MQLARRVTYGVVTILNEREEKKKKVFWCVVACHRPSSALVSGGLLQDGKWMCVECRQVDISLYT